MTYPLVVLESGTPVAGRSSRVGSSASLLPISPPTIIMEPFAIVIMEGYQRGTTQIQSALAVAKHEALKQSLRAERGREEIRTLQR